jgi:hypothetical protein
MGMAPSVVIYDELRASERHPLSAEGPHCAFDDAEGKRGAPPWQNV